MLNQEQGQKNIFCRSWFWLVIGLYLAFHLYKLTKLPVFADEAIYIRWAQLIIDDPQQYLFFPLNDGKTPLFIWFLVPFQFIFSDQLFAGRFLSVLVGLVQLVVIQKIIKKVGGSQLAQLAGLILTLILPFWFFHHRMALMDSLLSLFLSISWLFALDEQRHGSRRWLSYQHLKSFLFSGLFFGLALLTKIPALLFVPSLVITVFIQTKKPQSQPIHRLADACLTIGVGLLVFASLKLHPAFAQLFSRGSDFLFTPEEIITQQEWRTVLTQLPKHLLAISKYLTWPILVLSLVPLARDKQRLAAVSHLSWLFFAAPIFLLGKVVYPRYLLPVSIMLTVLSAIGIEILREEITQLAKKSFNRILLTSTLIGLVFAACLNSSRFITAQYFNPGETPFVQIDQTQYLQEWSAGYGVKPTQELISTLAKDKKVLVITEGYFGTLPDGLLLYFHRRNVEGIYITGMGQPIGSFSQKLRDLSQKYDQVLLVANSHRINTDLGQSQLLLEKCRPGQAPCHQVWDITSLLKQT